jgi:starch phosphorylase
MFIFGLRADEVGERHRRGFDPGGLIEASPALRRAVAALSDGSFSPDAPSRYQPIVSALRDRDHFMVTADFEAYQMAQREVDARWRDPAKWWASSIHNTAQMGWFSSDRTIREYARDIWDIPI